MPRKSNGSTTRRKKAAIVESAAAEPVLAAEVPINIAATAVGSETKANLDEEIRRRAYELYLQRNGQAGDPNRDWFIAEREVRARRAAAGHSA